MRELYLEASRPSTDINLGSVSAAVTGINKYSEIGNESAVKMESGMQEIWNH